MEIITAERKILKFTDVSSELYRVYTFGNGATVRIEEPKWLNVSNNGHRLVDSDHNSYYIPAGWVSLMWHVREGAPFFVR